MRWYSLWPCALVGTAISGLLTKPTVVITKIQTVRKFVISGRSLWPLACIRIHRLSVVSVVAPIVKRRSPARLAGRSVLPSGTKSIRASVKITIGVITTVVIISPKIVGRIAIEVPHIIYIPSLARRSGHC